MKKFETNGSGLVQEVTNSDLAYNELDNYSVNTYYSGDARNMNYLPDNSVHLIVTSPPYNVGIEYNLYHDRVSTEEYAEFVQDFLTEYFRVLVDGGRMAIVIANNGRNPYVSLTALYTKIAEEVGFTKRGEIIWVKGDSPNSTAWGSFCSPSNPSLRDAHEYILVFHKNRPNRPDAKGKVSTILPEMFMSCSNSVWRVNPITKKKADGHPASFPPELAERLIQFYSYEDDVVLDPMCGRGSTCIAAEKAGRRWIGNDIDLTYVHSRLQKEFNKHNREVAKQVRTDKKPSIGLTPAKLLDTRMKAEKQRKRKQKVPTEKE